MQEIRCDTLTFTAGLQADAYAHGEGGEDHSYKYFFKHVT